MVRMYFFIYVILVTLPLLEVLAGDDEEKEMCTCIVLGIKEDVEKCPDYDDVMIKVDLKMNLQPSDKDDEPDMVKLDGSIDSKVEIKDPTEVSITANLMTENGLEPVFKCGASVCASMQDEDAPWWPVLKYFDTTSCPVADKNYPVEGLIMDLGWAGGVLTSDFVGEYLIQISMAEGLDVIMCFLMGAEIVEVDKPCEECPEMQRKRK